jgi:hypothetical protein
MSGIGKDGPRPVPRIKTRGHGGRKEANYREEKQAGGGKVNTDRGFAGWKNSTRPESSGGWQLDAVSINVWRRLSGFGMTGVQTSPC